MGNTTSVSLFQFGKTFIISSHKQKRYNRNTCKFIYNNVQGVAESLTVIPRSSRIILDDGNVTHGGEIKKQSSNLDINEERGSGKPEILFLRQDPLIPTQKAQADPSQENNNTLTRLSENTTNSADRHDCKMRIHQYQNLQTKEIGRAHV